MRITGHRSQGQAAGTSRRLLFNLSVAAALGMALVLLLFVIGFSARAGATAPVISAISPTGTINTHNAAVTAYIGDGGGGVDNASIAVYVDGAAIDGCVIDAGNASCNVYGLDNGAHDIMVYASDNNGNVGSGSGSFTVLAPYEIKDDGAGGDCPLIGIWDAGAKKCTLSRDAATGSQVGIRIQSNNVTLDGNGHTITGSAYYGVQLRTSGFGITVKNLHVEGYQYGVYGQYANNNRIVDNTLSNWTIYGIFVTSSDNNTISGNTITAAGTEAYNGIFLHTNSDFNHITGNDISGGMKGLAIQFNANRNVFAGNTVRDTYITGAFILNSSYNSIHYNNFINTGNPSGLSGGLGNMYSVSAPIGGNYWSNYDEAAEGCADGNGDGFCDAPLALNGTQDQLPRVAPVTGCGKPGMTLSHGSVYWGSFADYEARALSVDYVVSTPAIAMYTEVVGVTATNGVSLVTGMPLEVGNLAGGGSLGFTVQYLVPPGAASFNTTVFTTAEDACGLFYEYPSHYPGP